VSISAGGAGGRKKQEEKKVKYDWSLQAKVVGEVTEGGIEK
jgi:hypothetical protein